MTRRPSFAGGPHGPRRSSILRTLIASAMAVAALCGPLADRPVRAHGVPTPLDFWGAFGRRIARCQRVIGRSAAVCGMNAWKIRRDCHLAELNGLSCDEAAADAAVEAARTSAINAVGNACTEQQVLTLVFLGTYEAESDIVSFCRQLEDAAVSAVFLPVPADPATATPEARACLASTAWATTKLLGTSFESRQQLLDRIALDSYPLPQKHAMVAASTASIAGNATALQSLMDPTCPADAFARTYGRDRATFFSQIASRADCLAGRTYAQGGILCPPAVCGNGMQEINNVMQQDEECDDGNLVDGDGCSSTCMRE